MILKNGNGLHHNLKLSYFTESVNSKFELLIYNQFLIMKKFIFGLIMMLFAFGTLPVQAHAPDDGMKIEILKALSFDIINPTEVSFEVPQIHLYNHCNYRPAELWNYSFKNSTNGLLIYEKQSQVQNWRILDTSTTNLKNSCIQNKILHIDPGSFSC